MSHTTTVKSIAIKDAQALRAAVIGLQGRGVKCALVEKAKPRMYYSGQGEVCDYVLKLEDSKYDVGFQRQEDGTYAPVTDFYANEVAGQIGADVNQCPMPTTAEGRFQHQMGTFMQEYAKAAAINQAAMQGYTVESSSMDEHGNVNLVLGGV